MTNPLDKHHAFAIKNIDSSYRYCNETLANILGLTSTKDMKNKKDSDFFPKNEQKNYYYGDHKIISGLPYLQSNETLTASNTVYSIITTKHPLIDRNDNIDGIIISIRNNSPQLLANNLEKIFTPREISIIRFIFLGLTNQMIAANLSRSKRTIEHHIENIKTKLGCKKRSYIIQALQEIGLNPFI